MKAFVIKFDNDYYWCGYNNSDKQLRKAVLYKSIKMAEETAKDCMDRIEYIRPYTNKIESYKIIEVTIAEGDLEQENKQLEEQLAEKDKEIEELEESNGVTKALYKNYYTQLQNYKSKLYSIDIPKLRKKHLTPEEKEIYYKGFENCERQFASHIADITIKVRKKVCDEIREKLEMNEYNTCENTAWCVYLDYLKEILDQIEQGEREKDE